MLPYLLASLPTPKLGATPALTIDAFLEACGRVLDAPRLAVLARAVGVAAAPPGPPVPVAGAVCGPPSEPASRPAPNAAERAWGVLGARVDDAVVRARCARTRSDPDPYLRHPRGLRIDVEEAVARAFATPHPGLRERALDELRWRLADELALSAPDGFAALYAHAVRLRLAWRWVAWDAEAGWRALEAALRVVDSAAGVPVAAGSPLAAPAGAVAGRVHDA